MPCLAVRSTVPGSIPVCAKVTPAKGRTRAQLASQKLQRFLFINENGGSAGAGRLRMKDAIIAEGSLRARTIYLLGGMRTLLEGSATIATGGKIRKCLNDGSSADWTAI